MRHAVVPALGDDLRARWTAWLADCSRVLKARRNKRTKRMTKNSRLSRLFFNYLNPHPSMKFDCTVKDGNVEHWVPNYSHSVTVDRVVQRCAVS